MNSAPVKELLPGVRDLLLNKGEIYSFQMVPMGAYVLSPCSFFPSATLVSHKNILPSRDAVAYTLGLIGEFLILFTLP